MDLLERTVKDQENVTDTLGEQVQRAIEVLIQSLDKADAGSEHALLKGIDAKTLYENSEYNAAFEKFKKAADKNSSEAEYYIGVSYAKGHGVIKSNKSAVDWYEKAANKQHIDANYELG